MIDRYYRNSNWYCNSSPCAEQKFQYSAAKTNHVCFISEWFSLCNLSFKNYCLPLLGILNNLFNVNISDFSLREANFWIGELFFCYFLFFLGIFTIVVSVNYSFSILADGTKKTSKRKRSIKALKEKRERKYYKDLSWSRKGRFLSLSRHLSGNLILA